MHLNETPVSGSLFFHTMLLSQGICEFVELGGDGGITLGAGEDVACVKIRQELIDLAMSGFGRDLRRAGGLDTQGRCDRSLHTA